MPVVRAKDVAEVQARAKEDKDAATGTTGGSAGTSKSCGKWARGCLVLGAGVGCGIAWYLARHNPNTFDGVKVWCGQHTQSSAPASQCQNMFGVLVGGILGAFVGCVIGGRVDGK